MPVKYTNNAAALITADIDAVVTEVLVDDVSLFPTLGVSDYMYLTLLTGANLEIVKVTDITGLTLTIERAQDDTTALAFVAGERAELRVTTAMLKDAILEAATSAQADADAAEAARDVAIASAAAALISEGLADDDAIATATDRVAVETLYDLFDDRYLGAKATDPALDNDGEALLDGAVYWNTTNKLFMAYDLGTTTWYNTTPSDAEQTNIDAVAAIDAEIVIAATNVADITNFADVYQGGKASDPATRNDTSALQAGDLYFNTTSDSMQVYDGAAWANATAEASAITVDTYADVTDYTSGTTTELTLTTVPEGKAWCHITFDGVTQHKPTWSLAGAVITFTSPIPLGTLEVEATVIYNIAVSGVPSATTTAEGLVEIATQTEVDAGTDPDRVVTAETLANYSEFPTGGGPSVGINGIIRTNANNITEDITLADHSVTFTADAGADTISVGTDDDYANGDTVYLTTTGTLPAGLALLTKYYVVGVAAGTLQLSATFGGSAIDITDTGTGTHSVYQAINGITAGTVTIETGFTVTVPEGSEWSIV